LERKQGKNRFYSLNRRTSPEIVNFLENMYEYNLHSLKEYVENENENEKSDKNISVFSKNKLGLNQHNTS
jgi:hypothetical protein